MALPFRAQFSFKIPATLSDFSSIQINRPAKVPRYDEAESLAVSRRRRRISLSQDSKRSGLGNGWTASSDIGIPSIKSYDVDGTRIPQVCSIAWEMVAICGVWKGNMDSTEARILYSMEREYCKFCAISLSSACLTTVFGARKPVRSTRSIRWSRCLWIGESWSHLLLRISNLHLALQYSVPN